MTDASKDLLLIEDTAGSGGEALLSSVDPATGNTRWRRATYSGARCAGPERVVHLAGELGSTTLEGLHAGSGEVVWSLSRVDGVELGHRPVYAVDERAVYLLLPRGPDLDQPESVSLVALDVSAGGVLWRTAMSVDSYHRLLPDRDLIVVVGDHTFAAVNPVDGTGVMIHEVPPEFNGGVGVEVSGGRVYFFGQTSEVVCPST